MKQVLRILQPWLAAGGIMALSSIPGAAVKAAPLSPVERYDYVVGTQTFGASYQFTGETKLVETAREILAMGSNSIKFILGPAKDVRAASLAETARVDPSIMTVLDMPFAHYQMWVSPVGVAGKGAFDRALLEEQRRQVYDLTKYLLTTYSGTGKTFYLGNWEGDWLLTHTNPSYVPTDAEVQDMIDWATTRQKAIDDAKRDTPHADVDVFYYIEVNRVADAREGKVRVANKVLPAANPDYVSYSSYDAQKGDIEKTYVEMLDYLQGQLKPKAGISGKRVFIGEYGMPALGNSPQAQDALARRVMRAGLRWGTPFVLYWEMYNNEVTPDGKQRGFWLIDDKRVKQPVYFTHADFLKKARTYVAEYYAKNGRVPTREEFGAASLAWLPVDDAAVINPKPIQGSPVVDDLRDSSLLYSRTPNLMFDSSNPQFFDGRASRLRRSSADTPQQIVYHGEGISRFQVTAYVYGGFTTGPAPKVRLYTSSDATLWTEIAVAQQATPTAGGWSKVILSPKETPSPAAYLKIELRDDPRIYSPQIGEVRLYTGGPGQ